MKRARQILTPMKMTKFSAVPTPDRKQIPLSVLIFIGISPIKNKI